MSDLSLHCQNLKEQVEYILDLLHQEPTLRSYEITPVQTSLNKAISPRFEIVFAGAFSAGKSMLINALLERELLYSAEGHATGTECKIEYAAVDQERVVLTFLSEVEIRDQAISLCKELGFKTVANINQTDVIDLLNQGCQTIYQFRQTLQQTSQGYDCESIVEAEPAIRQLLKLDFEPKVSQTIRKSFRQTINQILKNQLLEMAEKQADHILQQYPNARTYLEQTLEQEAEEKILNNQRLINLVSQKIAAYNLAVSSINTCLQSMQVHNNLLPLINDYLSNQDTVDSKFSTNGFFVSDGLLDVIAES